MEDVKVVSTPEQRKKEATLILEKYPGRIPCIIDRHASEKNLPEVTKKKFLCPKEMKIGELLLVVRRRLTVAPEVAVFFFVGNSIVPTSTVLSEVYENSKSEDLFLHLYYSGENTFG